MADVSKLKVIQGGFSGVPKKPLVATGALWTGIFLLGLVIGHVSESLNHEFDLLRIADLEKAVALCDTEVLRAQNTLNEAREAFFREKR